MQPTAFNSLVKALMAQVQLRAEQTCLYFLNTDAEVQQITYARLGMDVQRVAGLLRHQGIQPGELTVLLFPHSYELVVAFFGALACGAVPTIFAYYTPNALTDGYKNRLQTLLRQTGAHHLLTTHLHAAGVRQLVVNQGCQVTAIDTPGAAEYACGALDAANAEAPAYIQFSSGSTGTPRGAVISHRAALHNIAAFAHHMGFEAGDVGVSWLPFFHDMGLVTALLVPLLVGGQVVTMPPELWLRRPATLLRAVHTYQGVMTWMPNFAFAHCVRYIREQEVEGVDLSSWRTLGSGGEPVQFETLQRFAERFAAYGLKPTALRPGYGMAENVVAISHTLAHCPFETDWISRANLQTTGRAQPIPPHAPDAQAVVACGQPLPGVEVAILDEGGHACATREVGEIAIRGDSLFSGYFQQPETNATLFKDGWFRTGDRGYLADGQLYVLDRKKDLIISGGKNISPHALETIAQAVLGPELHRVAAFGLYDPLLGTEVPVLVCELRKQLAEAEQERRAAQVQQQVRESCDLLLADLRFVPRGLIEVTTSGKIARAATRENYQQAGFTPTNSVLFAVEAPTLDHAAWETMLQSLFAQLSGGVEPDLHRPFAELGIDSLALMRILLFLEEKTGRTVSMESLARTPTIAHLAQLLCPSPPTAHNELSYIPENDRYPIAQPPRRLAVTYHRRWLHAHLPYGLGTRILQQLTRPTPWRDKLFQQEITLIQRCLAQIETPCDPAAVIQQGLMVNTWPLWRSQALANPAVFQQWVSLRGIEQLNKAMSQGRGAVIAFPHTQLRLFLPQLPPLRQRELAAIGNLGWRVLTQIGLPHLAQAMTQGQALSKIAVRAEQLQHAHQVLRRGGVAIVLADATEGNGGIQQLFHGRRRPFRPGIAELALQSGAMIVPTFATMQRSGHITFEFLEPLAAQGGTHTQQTADLLHQYAVVLAEHWRYHFSNMEWFVLQAFLAFPPHP